MKKFVINKLVLSIIIVGFKQFMML